MTSVGDVLAVLGLFERIAVELRSYKNAPAHFQNLGVELELIQGMIRQVLSLDPQDGVDRDTLERIRAIALHCRPSLQAFAEKVRTKESSLGALRGPRSLGSIGKRLHWSMIEAKDINDLRQTVLAEMGAITILLSATQLKSIHHLSRTVTNTAAISTELRETCNAIGTETTSIAKLVARAPETLAELHRLSREQYDASQAQAFAMDKSIDKLQTKVDELAISAANESTAIRQYAGAMNSKVAKLYAAIEIIKKMIALLVTCSSELLTVIRRNTAMLLNMANQLKVITRAIEAVPLHLTLPVVRLDDALGETWALPFQACGTYDAFYSILKCVVFGNNRPGFQRVVTNQFSISLSKVGTTLTRSNWERFARVGMHIEQAITVSKPRGAMTTAEYCPYTGCGGTLPTSCLRGNETSKECSECGRLSRSQDTPLPIMDMGNPGAGADSHTGGNTQQLGKFRSDLPSINVTPGEDWSDFMRIEVKEMYSIQSEPEAREILARDPNNSAANTLLGLLNLRTAEHLASMKAGSKRAQHWLRIAKQHLLVALKLPSEHEHEFFHYIREDLWDGSNGELWYLLGRAFLLEERFELSYRALQQAIYYNGHSKIAWITISVLFHKISQYENSLESLSRTIRLDPFDPLAYFNLFVLYSSRNTSLSDARGALIRFSELIPQWELNSTFNGVQALLDTPDWSDLDLRLFRTMMQPRIEPRLFEAVEITRRALEEIRWSLNKMKERLESRLREIQGEMMDMKGSTYRF